MGFGYEKLDVYRRAMAFVEYRDAVLKSLRLQVAACDHLIRASESVPRNIAHGAASWNPKERAVFLGYANGSALECAACLDVLAAKNLLDESRQYNGKIILRQIVGMLITMKNETAGRVCEDVAIYSAASSGVVFDHDKLHAYQSSLAFIVWMTKHAPGFACSNDLIAKLDKASTSVVLNLAEGNGRFSNSDKVKFFTTASKANIQTSALLNIAHQNRNGIEQGQAILSTTGKLLAGLIKSKTR